LPPISKRTEHSSAAMEEKAGKRRIGTVRRAHRGTPNARTRRQCARQSHK
jgi:hypothetical protein